MPIEPYMPPISPLIMPEEIYDDMMAKYGIRLAWRKSHACPCMFGSRIPGSPDPQCRTCGGRGIYWDPPSDIFFGLLTWRHMSPTPDEFGAQIHENAGQLQHGEPTLTIPYTAGASGIIWQNASVYDAYVEVDATDRFSAQLQVNGIMALPYQNGVTVEASGAVTVYDTVNHVVTPVTGYVVSGASVTLPSGYAPETRYNVEFIANPVYVALRKAGALPMARPFGGAGPPINNLPRRFRIQSLDLWLRARLYPGDPSAAGM